MHEMKYIYIYISQLYQSKSQLLNLKEDITEDILSSTYHENVVHNYICIYIKNDMAERS